MQQNHAAAVRSRFGRGVRSSDSSIAAGRTSRIASTATAQSPRLKCEIRSGVISAPATRNISAVDNTVRAATPDSETLVNNTRPNASTSATPKSPVVELHSPVE